jgi:hypothetical protein
MALRQLEMLERGQTLRSKKPWTKPSLKNIHSSILPTKASQMVRHVFNGSTFCQARKDLSCVKAKSVRKVWERARALIGRVS